MAKELAVDYQNLEALQQSQADEMAGWLVWDPRNPYDGINPNEIKRAKYSPFGAELTYAICDAYPEIQLASFDYSDTIASKCSVDQMIGV